MTALLRWVLRQIATLGFVGYIPFAPGTFGTLVSVLVVALWRPPLEPYLAFTALVTLIGIVAAEEAERKLGRKDPGAIVIDEFAGYLVSMAFLPYTPGYLIAAFLLFRAFDILKPPPINRLQNIKGGIGVMADDILAGVYANVIIQLWIRI